MPTSTTVPRGFVATLRSAGVDLEAAARHAGLHQRAPDALTAEESHRLLRAVFAMTSDPTLGVRLGASIRPELFGVVGLAAVTAPSFGSAIARCARYKRLVSDLRVTVEVGADTARVGATAARSPAPGWQAEMELAFFASFGQRYPEVPTRPRRVCVRRAAIDGADVYRQVFGCAVTHGQPHDELWYDASALATPLVSADEVAHALLVQSADRLLDATREDVVSRAGAAVAVALPEGPVRVGRIARSIGMSERSLQRALGAQGTTFTRLVEETRKQLALHYLRDGQFEPMDISFLIGFSNPTSFYRAFRRWTSSTPERYRRQLGHERDEPSDSPAAQVSTVPER